MPPPVAPGPSCAQEKDFEEKPEKKRKRSDNEESSSSSSSSSSSDVSFYFEIGYLFYCMYFIQNDELDEEEKARLERKIRKKLKKKQKKKMQKKMKKQNDDGKEKGDKSSRKKTVSFSFFKLIISFTYLYFRLKKLNWTRERGTTTVCMRLRHQQKKKWKNSSKIGNSLMTPCSTCNLIAYILIKVRILIVYFIII